MGVFTPNIGLYIPAAGETGYDAAFASGMVNLDQHDHSGGPNKGLPISSSGLGNGSVTYQKLNANVADNTTGIGTNPSPSLQNQLQLLGVLKNLYTFASPPSSGTGFLSINGSTVAGRAFQDSSTATWTNADGIAGDPSVEFNVGGISPIPVDNGGTGVTGFTQDIILGGATPTGPLQQVAGVAGPTVLTSSGPGIPPTYQTLGALGQIQQAKVTLTASQVRNAGGTPITIVAAPGAGMTIIPISCYGLLNFVSSPFLSAGSPLSVAYNSTTGAMTFNNSAFTSSSNVYAWTTQGTSSGAGVTSTTVQNTPLTITNFGAAYTGGGTSTITFLLTYIIVNF